jgi:hypothetical protein
LPEVHATTQKKPQKDANKNSSPGTSKGKNKRKRTRKPHGDKRKGNNSKSNKDKSSTCAKYGCYNHPTQKYHSPKDLVDLYLNFVGHGRSNQGCSNQSGQQPEAHFNALTAPGCSNSAPADPSNSKAPLPLDGNIDNTDKMIIEYTSDDLFDDYIYTFSLLRSILSLCPWVVIIIALCFTSSITFDISCIMHI